MRLVKYLDLLNETGQNDWFNKKYSDIRAQFIEPQYVKDKTDKYVPVFRFIKNVYDAKGNQVNFNYVQLRYTRQPDNSLTCDTTGTGHTTPLVLTPIDPAQRLYSINYQGHTYRGVLDYQMKLNRVLSYVLCGEVLSSGWQGESVVFAYHLSS